MLPLYLAPNFKNYELIDSGNGEKLERFGQYILARPEPQAVWDKSLSEQSWLQKAHARFVKQKGSDEKGEWQNLKQMPEKWQMTYEIDGKKLNLKLSLSSFKHVGVFPEQAVNWDFIAQNIQKMGVSQPKILNLFAYTGVASLVAKAFGADVSHVESMKPTLSWARENMELSGLRDIRWVLEDAFKFVKREARRGNQYHGIILDPPAYGRGPEGEKWVLEEGINDLVKACAEILNPDKHFFILNLYSMGFSPIIAQNLCKMAMPSHQNGELGELYIPDALGKNLPLGVFYRFSQS